jgi:hypothetical protein
MTLQKNVMNTDIANENVAYLYAYDDIALDIIANLGGNFDSRSFGKEYLYAEIKDDPSLLSVASLQTFKSDADAENLKYIDELKRGLTYPIDPAQLLDLYNKLGTIIPNTQPEIRYKEMFELALHNPEMKDSIYNPEEIAKLKEIAQLCPFVEGNAVYMARVILHSVEPEKEYTNYCEFAKAPDRTSARQAVNVNAVIEAEIESNLYLSYQIVPNPNIGKFKIQCPNNEQFNYTIYDSKGSIIKSFNVKPLGNIVSIDLQNVTNGIYNITITTANYDRISIKFTINN